MVACTTEAPAPAPAQVPPPEASPAQDETAKAATPEIPELSEEDLALLAKDPKDLTPQMRVKRAHARRRQIMQNPDSPTARALRDLAEAHQAGELDLQKGRDGVWLHAPGTKPTHGRPPAGWRPEDADKPAPAPANPEPSSAEDPAQP